MLLAQTIFKDTFEMKNVQICKDTTVRVCVFIWPSVWLKENIDVYLLVMFTMGFLRSTTKMTTLN